MKRTQKIKKKKIKNGKNNPKFLKNLEKFQEIVFFQKKYFGEEKNFAKKKK